MRFKSTHSKLLLSFIILMLCFTTFSKTLAISEKQTSDIVPNTPKDWTVMLYFCADTFDTASYGGTDNSNNWLASAMNTVLEKLELDDLYPGSESNLNVIVLMDNPYFPNLAPLGNAEILKMEYGNKIQLDVLGATNMGSYYTLRDFINYCKTNYPATNYALEINDHGAGYAGMSYDFHGLHPYWNYSHGDCLSVIEVGNALEDAGGVDVLFLDICQGASFELMWELADNVHYVIAGQTLQTKYANHHMRDVLYELSRDTSMTPQQLADVGYAYAVNPVHITSIIGLPDKQWPTVGLFDLSKINTQPTVGSNFRTAFSNFAESLYDELMYNLTRGRILFQGIRNQLLYLNKQFSSSSLMIDLTHFAEEIVSNASIFHYEDQVISAANELLNQLTIIAGNLIRAEADTFGWSAAYDNMNGFSICFPNSGDYYQGYLYPNLYDTFNISIDTLWDDFIFKIFPDDTPNYRLPIPEFYELSLDFIDPCIDLQVYLMNEDLIQDPAIVGRGRAEVPGSFMGLELGIDGAEYIDDLIFGTTTILIPMTSLEPFKSNGANPYLTIKVNAASSPSAAKPVNLTVRHIKNGEVIWEDNKIQSIKIGEVFETNLHTDDTWTEFDVFNYNTTTKSFGIKKPLVYLLSTTTIFISIFCIIIRRKKKCSV